MAKLSFKEEKTVIGLLSEAKEVASKLECNNDVFAKQIECIIDKVEIGDILSGYGSMKLLNRMVLKQKRSDTGSTLRNIISSTISVMLNADQFKLVKNSLHNIVGGGKLTIIESENLDISFSAIFDLLDIPEPACLSSIKNIHEVNISFGNDGTVGMKEIVRKINSLIEMNQDDVFIITSKSIIFDDGEHMKDLKELSHDKNIDIVLITGNITNNEWAFSADCVMSFNKIDENEYHAHIKKINCKNFIDDFKFFKSSEGEFRCK